MLLRVKSRDKIGLRAVLVVVYKVDPSLRDLFGSLDLKIYILRYYSIPYFLKGAEELPGSCERLAKPAMARIKKDHY
jgi:hypothetical protein